MKYQSDTMKMFFALAGVLLAVSSCSKQNSVSGEQSELILSGQVEFQTTPTAADALPGKAGEGLDPLPATNIGVYVLTTSGNAPTDFASTAWKNEKFVSDASGNISGGDVTLRTGTTYGVYAYAPYVDGVGDAHAVPVNHGTDVLWAYKPNAVATAGGTKVQLAFQHCGAQIGFKLKAGDGATDLMGAKLEVGGFFETGMLDLETGGLTLSDPTQVLTKTDGTKTNILVTGQDMVFSVTVTDVPGRSESFTGSFTRTLVPGKSYLYDVTVNIDGEQIDFFGKTTDWVNVESTDPVPAG